LGGWLVGGSGGLESGAGICAWRLQEACSHPTSSGTECLVWALKGALLPRLGHAVDDRLSHEVYGL
jgi:hypothetical protein